MRDRQFDISSLHSAYENGYTPLQTVDEVWRRIAAAADPGIFISLEDRDRLRKQAAELGTFDPVRKPLWGIPFAVKDNIDAAGLPTTAACPAYAYKANTDAFCVALLREAGALMMGKTNLDQFATGLVGLRTPYPVPKNAIDPTLVPGGSSSGSAVAVSRGIVSFALGTDTAGSGRVPAALNNIVGLKPTLGTISSSGVIPACRTLDTVSVLALNVGDAYSVFQHLNHYDEQDAYSRRFHSRPIGIPPPKVRVGVPDDRTKEFCGDMVHSAAFEASLQDLESLGATLVPIDFRPFYDVAQLLYAGAWVAERYTVIENLLKSNCEAIHPVIRRVIEVAHDYSAADAFRHFYQVADIRAGLRPTFDAIDILCVPSTPTLFRLDELEEDPFSPNSKLGTYTNFVNILDLCALTVPSQKRSDGLPGSVTLLAAAGRDAFLADIGRLLHGQPDLMAGATSWPISTADHEYRVGEDEIELAVVGAHMSALPLNSELTRLDARFIRTAKTASTYKLYALAGGPPHRPGLVRDDGGRCIELETWALPKQRLGEFMAGIPQPLGIGTIDLEDGSQVAGFNCETAGLNGATEITKFGGWRKFLSSIDEKV